MKKTLLLAIGMFLILIVGGVWMYLFVFGTPANTNDVFSNFGFGGENIVSVPLDTNPSIVDTSPLTQGGSLQALRQLTTRPVAGAVFIDGGIRYAERGTGHIYDIMFSTGNESLVVGTTLPQLATAVFSASGSRVALTSKGSEGTLTSVGTITKNDAGEGVVDGIILPPTSREIAFSDTGEEVYYLQNTSGGANGYSYNLVKETSKLLFTIPLQDVEMLWGDINYVYTTPSIQQKGYLYRVSGNNLLSMNEGRFGLVGMNYAEGIIMSYVENNEIHSSAFENGVWYKIPPPVFREKCTNNRAATSSLYCSRPSQLDSSAYPDDWYKGIVSYSDTLWVVNTRKDEARLLSDFKTESGREIDVSEIGTNDDGSYLYFINKNDDTLWMFDTTL